MRLSAQPLRTTYSLTGLHLSSVVARAHRSRRAIVALQRLRPVRVAPGLEADDAVRNACGQAAGRDASMVMRGSLQPVMVRADGGLSGAEVHAMPGDIDIAARVQCAAS